MKKASFENLKELLENHKKETYSCKEYSFDNTSYTLLLADINNLLKENELLKQQAKKQKEVIDKVEKILNECKLLMLHEFDWEEQVEKSFYGFFGEDVPCLILNTSYSKKLEMTDDEENYIDYIETDNKK